MKFGIHNPSFVFPGSSSDRIFDDLKQKAQWAEAHGFTIFTVMDHLVQIPGVGEADEPFMESWTTLGALAASTQNIRLAPMVTSVSYRNPALLAKMATTVDIISHGRLTLSMGGGWYERDYQQYGYDFPPAPVRLRQLEEAVQIIRQMWTQPRTTFHGHYFHVDDVILEPKPVQKPHPPLLIGGGGEQVTLRLVARYADACNVSGDVAVVAHKLEVLRHHCEREGRDYDTIERTSLAHWLLARDESALKAKVERLRAVDPSRVTGLTVQQAIDLAGQYADLGVQTLIVYLYANDPESQELLASEILPKFA